MIKKIIIVIFIILHILIIVSQSKYIKQENFTIAKINIDTIAPEIEILNIQNIMYEKEGDIIYDVIINFKIIESNIKKKNIDNIKIFIDEKNIESFKMIEKDNKNIELFYELSINNLKRNQIVKIIMKKGIVIDNANNQNEEKIIEHKIS